MIKFSHRDPRFIEGFVKECHKQGLDTAEIEEMYDHLLAKEAGWLGRLGSLATLGLGAYGAKHYYDKAFPRQRLTDRTGEWENSVGQRQGLVSQISSLRDQGHALTSQIKALAGKNDPVSQSQAHELTMARNSVMDTLKGYTSQFQNLTGQIDQSYAPLAADVNKAEMGMLNQQSQYSRLDAQKNRGGLAGWWAGRQMKSKQMNPEAMQSRMAEIQGLRGKINGFNARPIAPELPKEWRLQ